MDVIFNQHIQVVRPQPIHDPYSSKPKLDYRNASVIDVGFPVSIQPTTTADGQLPRGGISEQFLMITPPGTNVEIRPSDRIRAGGTLDFDILGAPQHWPDPWKPGEVHHVEVLLEVRRG